MKRIVLLLALSFSVAVAALAKAPVDTVRILSIGNSFSQDAVEQYFYELTQAGGIPVIIGNAYIGGCSLERHLRNTQTDAPDYAYRKIGENGDARKKETKKVTLETILLDEPWDYVSFQQSSPLSGMYETYAASLPALMEYVKARVPADVHFMFHQTWAYQQDSDRPAFKDYGHDQMTMYNAIIDAVQKAVRLVGIKTVIPSGTAVQNARTSFVGDNMTRDGYHLDLTIGRYTAACTWYEKIFGHVLDNSYAPQGLSPDRVEVARRSARAAVKHPVKVTKIKVKEL